MLYAIFHRNAELLNENKDVCNPVYFPWEKLTSFQRLILIRILRPEHLKNSVRKFITEKMGYEYLQRTGANLKDAYKESNARTPLILIQSHGTDLTNILLRFAQELKGTTHHVTMVSLGHDQAAKAEDLTLKALTKTQQWVFLQNCHLAASFMPRLCTLVEFFNSPDMTIDPEFLLWLSSKSYSSFPIPILQKGLKICQPVPGSASIKDCIHIIQSLPDDDPPEVLGVHPEAIRSCSETQGQKFIENLIALQPKTTTANLMIRPEQSNEELVMEILSDLLKRLPLTVEKEEHAVGMPTTLKSMMSSSIWESLSKNLKETCLHAM
nr:dynein heavy chain 14, axonemal isoform X1 [Aotus nancymaae]XP_012315198.1 dynein heavy chain 14, axonemal isoform X1 [Aotus nancymaae]